VTTVFFRLLEADDKASALRRVVSEPAAADGKRRFEVHASSFASVPRSPFAYWVSERVRRLFTDLSRFEASGRVARQGGVNGDDFRWLRVWLETTSAAAIGRWVPIAKGGAFSPFYADLPLVAAWDSARDTFWAFTGLPHRPSLKPASFDFYFRPGLTWPRRTQGGLSLRVMPAGCVFADKGPALFVAGDVTEELLAILAVVNAQAFKALIDLQMAFGSYEVGVVQRTPVPDLTPSGEVALAILSRRAWTLKRNLDTRTETSHAFVLPALLQVAGETLAAQAAAWTEHVREVEAELAAIQAEIDERCFVLYGIDDEDRRGITYGFGGSPSGSATSEDEGEEDAEAEDEGEGETAADAATLAAELVSWAVGVAFGRFDGRRATGARGLPVEPEPFDPLPVCSPAMLTGDDGLPLARPPAGYPLAFPEDGIFVDDPGHPRDLTAALRAVFETVFGSRADAVWQETAALLDPRGHDLRTWLAGGFFEHHLRRHSKSRRKAPILWQLGVPSGRYSVWGYAHRLTRDSLIGVQNDVVAPKLAHEERRRSSLVTQAGPTPSAHDRADIATQEAIVDELRALLDEVRRVAPLWNPDLDDGIVLVMASLWRLVPGHRAWQKELKSRWDELVAGKYDWAHLAMHLWPERVVPKCATDRGLAIAHGLEGIFWIEGADGKWTRRSTPTRPLDELVAERTSPAVKAALASLLEAPGPAGGGGGRRARSNAGVSV
jgi:hypothetical protein